jgi:cytidyltransferase-like protein
MNIIVSGYFIWIHIGHIRLFREASKYGKLKVILNNDLQQKLKYGKIIVSYKERKEVLESIKYIDKVVKSIDKDKTVCKSLAKYNPEIFINGGDVNINNIPEKEVCKKLRIKMLFGIGGNKIQSSSTLIKNI